MFKITNKINYLYKTNQKIKTANSLDLISEIVNLKSKNASQKNITLNISNSFKNKRLNLQISEKLVLNHYIPAHLKYTNLQSCLLV